MSDVRLTKQDVCCWQHSNLMFTFKVWVVYNPVFTSGGFANYDGAVQGGGLSSAAAEVAALCTPSWQFETNTFCN